MGGLDLLLIGGDAYLSFLLSLLRLILGKAEFDSILVLINFPCVECRHANVDRDDDFRLISHENGVFTCWDALGGPIHL